MKTGGIFSRYPRQESELQHATTYLSSLSYAQASARIVE